LQQRQHSIVGTAVGSDDYFAVAADDGDNVVKMYSSMYFVVR